MAINDNDILRAKRLSELKKFQEPLQHLNSEDSALLLVQIQEKLGVSLDIKQESEIKILEKRIQAAIGNAGITKDNVHTIVDLLKTINDDIQKAQGVLFRLTRNEDYLQDESQKKAVLYQLNIIFSRTRQLKLLTEQIKIAIENKKGDENDKIPQQEIRIITKALFNIDYFKNQKFIPISISDWLAEIFLPKIANIGRQCKVENDLEAQLARQEKEQKAAQERESEQLVQQLVEEEKAFEEKRKAEEQASNELAERLAAEEQAQAEEARKAILEQAIETLPRWLQEMTALALSNNLRNKYQRSSAYLNTNNFDDKFANFIQKKLSPSKTRIAQLKLIEDTLKLLNKSEYDAEHKIKIARGLMLFVKYQIEHQDNKFKSRLGIMLDEYINATDNSGGKIREFSAKECMEAFKDFSKTRLKTRNKIQGAIEKAVNDNGNGNWKNITTASYQSKQKKDTVTNKTALVFTYPKLGTQEKRKKKISEARIQIMKIKTSIDQYPELSTFEAMYQETVKTDLETPAHKKNAASLGAITNKLNYARNTYEAMCESRIKNVSAEKLVKEIKQLTNQSKEDNSIRMNIGGLNLILTKLEKRGTPPNEEEKRQIYIDLRRVEQQLETLVYLAEIAELKLDPSANRIRHVSDEQAKELKNAVKEASGTISDFKYNRANALRKLGIEGVPQPRYRGR